MFKVTDQEALAARDKVESQELVEAYREAGKAFSWAYPTRNIHQIEFGDSGG